MNLQIEMHGAMSIFRMPRVMDGDWTCVQRSTIACQKSALAPVLVPVDSLIFLPKERLFKDRCAESNVLKKHLQQAGNDQE
jgi:hypothetical protein